MAVPHQESILVTGGAGFIGSHVVLQLSEAGHRVVVVDDFSTGFPDSLLHNEQVYHGDYGDRELLSKIFTENQIAAVFHFAAAIVVPESVANPLKYYERNLVSSVRLLEAVAEHGIPNFIFSSTAAVYGDVRVPLVTEETPALPGNPYGASKLMVERIIRDLALAQPSLRYAILRYFNVAGAEVNGRLGQRTKNATHLIKVACEAALGERKSVEIFGTDYPTIDGTGVRDYIHIQDLANAHLAALDYLAKGGESTLLNVGYGRGMSVRQVIEMVKRVSGRDFEVIESGRRPGDPAEVVAEGKKVVEVLGWQPQYDSIERIVEDSWKWTLRMAVPSGR